jgi:hypothetical protein
MHPHPHTLLRVVLNEAQQDFPRMRLKTAIPLVMCLINYEYKREELALVGKVLIFICSVISFPAQTCRRRNC